MLSLVIYLHFDCSLALGYHNRKPQVQTVGYTENQFDEFEEKDRASPFMFADGGNPDDIDFNQDSIVRMSQLQGPIQAKRQRQSILIQSELEPFIHVNKDNQIEVIDDQVQNKNL